ncbi:fibronectin type III domain protein [Teladorsagia circumcincta]|uniref:Fibronectin type III domain protein n=1 Tax=Teladorsagia circumcincta TaxID=45464 RepID=A0A2G9UPQ1_TELCI|nr:fibronectin type III domain protein [Teladorsagia circumcincta]
MRVMCGFVFELVNGSCRKQIACRSGLARGVCTEEVVNLVRLRVCDHNTKSVFSRMPDRSNFPSAPSQPIASNVSDSEVDLEWRAPERNGGSPVTGYIIQFFSPDVGETWLNVPDYVSGPRYRIKNLRPSQTYVFVVRAENEKGIGPPSPISSVVNTLTRNAHLSADDLENLDLEQATRRITSEQLIKLEEVKTINSTAVRLFWKRKKIEDMVEGWVNVSGAHVESYVVNGLMPFTNYEFFVIPYHKSIQGAPSNSMDALTAEAPPSLPPSDVHIRMLNLTTLRIGWRAPPADGMNGILKGFQIVILGKGTKFNRNITTNERAASVTLFHLIPGMTYKIRVAARTNAGIGVSHGTDTVTMTAHPPYSVTPNHQDFFHAPDDYMAGTMNRPGSEHHYHYAQLAGGPGNTLSTFYGNQYQDDPSPYATTTLVMSNQQPSWLNDRMLRGPVLPSNPVPNGPPARYADHTGRRSRGSRASEHRQASHHSDSPPHTDFQSSDGTGESSNGRSKPGTMAGRRSPPKHTLMDFIPPPPSNPPPPADVGYEGSPRRHLPRMLNMEDPYDSVSDGMAFGDEMKVRPTSRNRTTGIRPQKGNRDDDSQRSSLMMDEEGGSSEADGETSDCEAPKRKTVPRMDDSGRSASRFKSMQRGKQDHL